MIGVNIVLLCIIIFVSIVYGTPERSGFLPTLGVFLAINAGYLALYSFGAFLVCLVFALPEKISAIAAALLGLTIGSTIEGLLTYVPDLRPFWSEPIIVIMAVVYALLIARLGWKFGKTSVLEE
jgi:hypothetical protein